jgi:hypothetical protein
MSRTDYDTKTVFQERIALLTALLATCSDALDQLQGKDAHPNRHYLLTEIKYLLSERERAQRRLASLDNADNHNHNS